MNDGRRRRQAKQARRDARRRAMRPVTEPSLVEIVRNALDMRHPSNMLGLIGVMVELIRQKAQRSRPTVDAIASQLIPERTAVLAVLARDDVGDGGILSRGRKAFTQCADAAPQSINNLSSLESPALSDPQSCSAVSMASDVALWSASLESVLARIDLNSRDTSVVDMTPAYARTWMT